MHCQLCGYAFDATDMACHTQCPMGSRCNLICCPNCGYQVVDESKSRFAGLLRRFMPSDGEGEYALSSKPQDIEELVVPLTHIPIGVEVEVRSLDALSARRQGRLSVFGLVPGQRVEIQQRRPAPVIRIGETELALSEDILEQIWVRPREAKR